MTDLSIASLRARYLSKDLTPAGLVEEIWPLIDTEDKHNVWIRKLKKSELLSYANALTGKPVEDYPLYGIPFAIKDNIDLEGIETTAACPEFSYMPNRSATVVQNLIDAGAIPIGKTNLDQFATGLVGARSPYGPGRNSFDPEYISGGSSSGSAVAVALGQASFSLGTDTAGSGRVPAAFNNLIGLKPTCGIISNSGMVPACRSLDAVAIFALNAGDAGLVLSVASGEDETDPYSRATQPYGHDFSSSDQFAIGIPQATQLEFFGDREAERLFFETVADLKALGASFVEFDLSPFLEAARLLYEGPFVAERYAAIRAFFDTKPDALHPITRKIVADSRKWLAADLFESQDRLAELKTLTDQAISQVDCLMTPTTGTIYRVAEVEADPITLNSNLGYYTNFLNLLDYMAVAVPSGMSASGLPYGVTLVGKAFDDAPLLRLAARLHPKRAAQAGATGYPVRQEETLATSGAASGVTRIAVCAAHLTGLSLNHQLTERGSRLIGPVKSAACYKLLALPGGPPYRAGIIRALEGGAAIDLEVWDMPTRELGSFLAGIPSPLGLGKVELSNGKHITGFICEGFIEADSEDITIHGGWRKFLESLP